MNGKRKRHSKSLCKWNNQRLYSGKGKEEIPPKMVTEAEIQCLIIDWGNEIRYAENNKLVVYNK